MPGPNVGYATLSIIPSTQGIAGALSGQLGGDADAAGAAAGGRFAGGFSSVLKGGLLAGGAVVAVGAGLAAIGDKFDSAFDDIRTQTGATGDVLAGLEDSFRSVVTTVPTDFATASSAIGDINSRLGLTGKPLEELTDQFINLSRITDTDIAGNVDNITRVFGDWGIATSQQASSMDELFRASQASGIGIGDLSSSVVQFGAPLRNLGFGFDQSLALLSQFNKTGVNTDTVVAGLKAGVGKLAKAGEDVPSTFKRIVDQITQLGPGTEATSLAIQLFGQRAGPDLADAIAGGKFEIGSMLDTITGGSDTINAAASDTDDWRESWTLFKNKALVLIEPIATRVFNLLGDGMDRLGPLFEEFVGGVRAFIAAFQAGGDDVTSSGFAGQMERIGLKVREFWDSIQPFVDWLKDNWKPVFVAAAAAVGLIVAPFATVAAAVVLAYVKFKPFRDAVDATYRFLKDVVAPAIVDFAHGVSDVFAGLVAAVRKHWDAISEAIGHVVHAIQVVIELAVGYIQTIWQAWGDEILRIASTIWDQIKLVVETAIGLVRGIIQTVVALINGDWGQAWDGIKGVIDTVWTYIRETIENILGVIAQIIEGAVSSLRVIWDTAWGALQGTVSTVWETISGIVSGAIDTIMGFIGGIASRVASTASGMWDGISSAFSATVSALKGIWNAFARFWNGIELHVPSVHIPLVGDVGGFTLGLPDLPTFHRGGRVPGAAGEEVPALLLAGETVLPPGVDITNVEPMEVRLTFNGVGDDIVRMLRRKVQVTAGGNVQVALGA